MERKTKNPKLNQKQKSKKWESHFQQSKRHKDA